ncbi:hypothetical protein GW796_10930 [archaeon]|nr:hypothetical protein [archaeon]
MWSIFFAVIGTFYLLIPQYGGFFLFPFFILIRLLCNLFDGMVAIEMKLNNPLGSIYNEFPDRITDTIFIISAGYVSGYQTLALFGSLFAIATAYIRIFGVSLGFTQDFQGLQSKSQRMAV